MSAVWKLFVETPTPKPMLLIPIGDGVGLACSMGMPMLPVQDLQLKERFHSTRPLVPASFMPLRALAKLMSESASLHARSVRLPRQVMLWSWAKHGSLQQEYDHLQTQRCASESVYILPSAYGLSLEASCTTLTS